MSHAEAFGHFRSFAVGLEKNARELRRLLEDTGDSNKKWSNGKAGINARCARALECASPEVTTKELVAEVAELNTSLRGVEATMQANTAMDEAIEKYKTIVEYNQLAFMDLEERLSAYGYVRPTVARAASGAAGSTSAGAPRLCATADAVSTQGDKDEETEGDGAGAPGEAGGNATDCDHQREHDHGVPCEENASAHPKDDLEPTNGAYGEGDETPVSGGGGRDGESAPVGTGGHDIIAEGVVVATPTRPRIAVVPERPASDVDSPATPTLAEWEISEATREMLRREQEQHQKQSKSYVSSVPAARSLEVLLAQNSTATGAGEVIASRHSVSSSWSPPRLHESSSGPRGGRDGGARDSGGCSDGTAAGSASRGAGDDVVSSLGWRSDPPTPRMPSLDGGGRWKPEGRESSAGSRGRDSFVETPEAIFTSPMKTQLGRSLMEATMGCEQLGDATPREDAGGTPRIDGESSCAVTTSSDPTPGLVFMQGGDGGDDGVGDTLWTGPQDEFWGADSPASPVCPSRETADDAWPGRAGQRGYGLAASPETPRTPPMLSPRHRTDSVERGSGVATSPVRSARLNQKTSSSLAPTEASLGPLTEANHNHGRYVHAQGGDGERLHDSGEEDDDDCRTPELFSPPRTEFFGGLEAADVDTAGAAVCRRLLEEADGGRGDGEGQEEGREDGDVARTLGVDDGPLELVSEEEYARAPTFLTIQVSRPTLNEAIRKLNAFAAPRLSSPSELLLTVDEIIAIIDQGALSQTLLISVTHLKRVEMKGSRMYRIRGKVG